MTILRQRVDPRALTAARGAPMGMRGGPLAVSAGFALPHPGAGRCRMAEGRAPVRVASPAVAVLARVAGVLLLGVGAVTGVVVHAFWTWLLASFVAALLVALAGRTAAQASVRARRPVAASQPPAVAQVQLTADRGELLGVQLDGRQREVPVVPQVRRAAEQSPDVGERGRAGGDEVERPGVGTERVVPERPGRQMR
jgi:hypothetical protein